MQLPLDIVRLEFYVYQLLYHLSDISTLNTVGEAKERRVCLSHGHVAIGDLFLGWRLTHSRVRALFLFRHVEIACGLLRHAGWAILLPWLPDGHRPLRLLLLLLKCGTVLLGLARDLAQLIVRLGVLADRLQPLTEHNFGVENDANYLLF